MRESYGLHQKTSHIGWFFVKTEQDYLLRFFAALRFGAAFFTVLLFAAFLTGFLAAFLFFAAIFVFCFLIFIGLPTTPM
jgi:hypothetical protein